MSRRTTALRFFFASHLLSETEHCDRHRAFGCPYSKLQSNPSFNCLLARTWGPYYARMPFTQSQPSSPGHLPSSRFLGKRKVGRWCDWWARTQREGGFIITSLIGFRWVEHISRVCTEVNPPLFLKTGTTRVIHIHCRYQKREREYEERFPTILEPENLKPYQCNVQLRLKTEVDTPCLGNHKSKDEHLHCPKVEQSFRNWRTGLPLLSVI